MNAGLFLLAFRRSLPRAFVAAIVIVLAVAAQVDWAPAAAWSVGEVRAGAFVREGVWTCGLLVLAPILVRMSASTIARWRAGEVDWLAKSPTGRGRIVASTWCGQALAAACVLAAIALTAELAARDPEPCFRVVARTTAVRGAIVDSSTTLRWSSEPLAAVAHARLQVGIAIVPSAPAAEVRLSATRRARDGSVHRSQARRHVSAATAIELDVPAGEGPVEIELAREGDGAIVVLDGRGTAWLAPLGNAAWTSAGIAVRAALALAAWLALAIGFGARLSSGLATCALIALALPAWLGESSWLSAWTPWAELPAAIELVGRGLGAPHPAASAWLGTAACVVIGLAAARIDLAQWRRNA